MKKDKQKRMKMRRRKEEEIINSKNQKKVAQKNMCKNIYIFAYTYSTFTPWTAAGSRSSQLSCLGSSWWLPGWPQPERGHGQLGHHRSGL